MYIYIHNYIYIGFVSKWRAPIHRHCVIKKLSLKTSDGMRYPCFGLFLLEKNISSKNGFANLGLASKHFKPQAKFDCYI